MPITTTITGFPIRDLDSIYLTKKQLWMLHYVAAQKRFVSPTEVGNAYGEHKGKSGYHSSTASPVLLRLTEMGFMTRNKKGHYLINPNE